MPFGLTNAPAVFQQFINKVLGNLLDVCAVGYIDNILIYMDSVEYLGFILTPTGINMDPAKVAMIQNWLELRNVHDMQSFLGLVNFYCCFIVDYSQMTLPLTNLCKKATPWNFGKREMTAF